MIPTPFCTLARQLHHWEFYLIKLFVLKQGQDWLTLVLSLLFDKLWIGWILQGKPTVLDIHGQKGLPNSALSVCSFAHFQCVHIVLEQYIDIPFFCNLSLSLSSQFWMIFNIFPTFVERNTLNDINYCFASFLMIRQKS